MKITEYVNTLLALKAEHGDVRVMTYGSKGRDGDFVPFEAPPPTSWLLQTKAPPVERELVVVVP